MLRYRNIKRSRRSRIFIGLFLMQRNFCRTGITCSNLLIGRIERNKVSSVIQCLISKTNFINGIIEIIIAICSRLRS